MIEPTTVEMATEYRYCSNGRRRSYGNRAAVSHLSLRPSCAKLLIVLALFCTFSGRGACYDYAVQPRLAQFHSIPQSQTLIKGDNIVLSCNFSITKLGSNYPVPHLEWWKTGTTIMVVEPSDIEIEQGYIYSELSVNDTTKEDEGRYQCIAVDGKKKFKKTGPGQYISSSPIATIQVLTVEDFPDDTTLGSGQRLEQQNGTETVTITLNYGEPYVVPCELGRVGISSHILWFQNGTLLNDQNMVLSNGSLLLPAATPEDSGLYHCSLQFRDHSLYSHESVYIQVNRDVLYEGEPHLFTDVPATVPIFPGNRFTFRCYVLGAPPIATPTGLKLELLRGNESLISSVAVDSINYLYTEVNESEVGMYGCRLSREENVIFSIFVNLVQGYHADSRDEYVVIDDNELPLSSNQNINTHNNDHYRTISWFRDGFTLPALNGVVSHTLTGNNTSLDGHIYQRVVVTATGVIYQDSWRIFDIRYTNPPTNFECSVQFTDFDGKDYGAEVIASWERPDFIALAAGANLRYKVDVESGLTEADIQSDTMIVLDLPNLGGLRSTELLYKLRVRTIPLYTDIAVFYDSAPAICDFHTVSRANNPPLPINEDCTSERVKFTWTNPLFSTLVPLEEFLLQVTCIYGRDIYKFQLQSPDDAIFSFFDPFPYEQRAYEVVANVVDPPSQASQSNKTVPSGTACYATGYYRFDRPTRQPRVEMQPDSCTASTRQPTKIRKGVYLGLECHEGEVNMTWATWERPFISNISLQTLCLFSNSDAMLTEVFSYETSVLNGIDSINVTSLLLCSFYGQYYDTERGENVDITPVQCTIGHPIDNGVEYPLPPSPPSTTTSTSTEDKVAPTDSTTTIEPSVISLPSSDKNYKIVLEISLPGSLVIVAAILLILIIIIVLRCRSSSRFNPQTLELSMKMHELNMDFQPFNPGVIGKMPSMATIYDNGEGWDDYRGSLEQAFQLETETPSDSELGSNPISERFRDSGDTPVLSPVVIVAMEPHHNSPEEELERSGRGGLQLEMSGDGNGGKKHVFNKFLTDVEDEEQGNGNNEPSNTQTMPEDTRLVIRTDNQTSDSNISSLSASSDQQVRMSSASSSIAQLVAERLQRTPDSTVPSSGYGTDCYKFSSDGGGTDIITPEYLARKLRDVEELESATPVVITANNRSDTAGAPPTNSDLSNSDMTPPTDKTTTSKIDLSLTNIVNGGGREVGHLPTLVLTPPQVNGVSTMLSSISASTGDLSSSSYYKVNEGYLDVSSLSSATTSGQSLSSHHISFDTKSL